MLLCISIVAAVLVAAALYRLFFTDSADFLECLRFYFTPNIISWFRGEARQDRRASAKLGLWASISVAMGVAVQYKLPQFFPSLQSQSIFASARSSDSDLEDTPKPPTPDAAPANSSAESDSEPAIAPPSGSATSDYAKHYKVKIGDTAEIAAMNRAIVLRRALVTGMDHEKITVRSGNDSYTFKWSDINRLKSASAAAPAPRKK